MGKNVSSYRMAIEPIVMRILLSQQIRIQRLKRKIAEASQKIGETQHG